MSELACGCGLVCRTVDRPIVPVEADLGIAIFPAVHQAQTHDWRDDRIGCFFQHNDGAGTEPAALHQGPQRRFALALAIIPGIAGKPDGQSEAFIQVLDGVAAGVDDLAAELEDEEVEGAGLAGFGAGVGLGALLPPPPPTLLTLMRLHRPSSVRCLGRERAAIR